MEDNTLDKIRKLKSKLLEQNNIITPEELSADKSTIVSMLMNEIINFDEIEIDRQRVSWGFSVPNHKLKIKMFGGFKSQILLSVDVSELNEDLVNILKNITNYFESNWSKKWTSRFSY